MNTAMRNFGGQVEDCWWVGCGTAAANSMPTDESACFVWKFEKPVENLFFIEKVATNC